MTDNKTPTLIDWNFKNSIYVGKGIQLLFYDDGTIGFMHKCNRRERGIIICAPKLQPEHKVVYEKEPGGYINPRTLTITPSILCPDCGTHGYVTNGFWRPV